MMHWKDGRPRVWYGWADIGAIQIPPMPVYLILTDRADGTLWWLTYSTSPAGDDGYGYISITTTQPPSSVNVDSLTFPAYDGPMLGQGKLMVRSGFLGVDTGPDPHTTEQESGVWAQKAGLNRSLRRLIFSTATPGNYAWIPVDITQTPNP